MPDKARQINSQRFAIQIAPKVEEMLFIEEKINTWMQKNSKES